MQCLLSLSGAILKFDEGNQNWQQQKVFSTIIKNSFIPMSVTFMKIKNWKEKNETKPFYYKCDHKRYGLT